MDLETFKQKCKKTVPLTEKDAIFACLLYEQKEYNDDCYAPKTKFEWHKIWWKKIKTCPVCGEKLKKEPIGKWKEAIGSLTLSIDTHVIYSCGCGYEYAAIEEN